MDLDLLWRRVERAIEYDFYQLSDSAGSLLQFIIGVQKGDEPAVQVHCFYFPHPVERHTLKKNQDVKHINCGNIHIILDCQHVWVARIKVDHRHGMFGLSSVNYIVNINKCLRGYSHP